MPKVKTEEIRNPAFPKECPAFKFEFHCNSAGTFSVKLPDWMAETMGHKAIDGQPTLDACQKELRAQIATFAASQTTKRHVIVVTFTTESEYHQGRGVQMRLRAGRFIETTVRTPTGDRVDFTPYDFREYPQGGHHLGEFQEAAWKAWKPLTGAEHWNSRDIKNQETRVLAYSPELEAFFWRIHGAWLAMAAKLAALMGDPEAMQEGAALMATKALPEGTAETTKFWELMTGKA